MTIIEGYILRIQRYTTIAVNKTYILIQVMGTYTGIYHLLQYDIHRNLP